MKHYRIISLILLLCLALGAAAPAAFAAETPEITAQSAAETPEASAQPALEAPAITARSAIVIDLGTATTITAIDAKKAFRGGAILPGVKLSFSALAAGTSLLPDIYISKPEKCIGTNTADCMRSGAVLGTASMIDGMIDRMEEELGTSCALIATGGLASSVVPCCRHEIICDDDLLLKGLWTLYKKNAGWKSC